MIERLNKLAEKINALSIRERGIIFIGVLVVLFTIYDYFLFTPLEKEQKKFVVSLNEKNAERLMLVKQLQELISTGNQDPNAENIAKLKKLRSHLIEVQADLESSTNSLVTPKDMPKILETVLHKIDGLTLVNLKSLGVTPIVAKDETETNTESVLENASNDDEQVLTVNNIDNAYKHGLRIEIIGNYLTTLSYLKSLEELEWRFFWDNFKLTVNEYPDANIKIEIFTLSLNQEWIGV